MSSKSRVNYVYVIRRRDDGEAVYVGMTNNPARRMQDHASKDVLAKLDPDDYEMCVVAGFVGKREQAFAAEYNLTVHLQKQGIKLLNEQVGNDQTWRQRPFFVVDVIDQHNMHVMCTMSQSNPWRAKSNVALLRGLKQRHPQWLSADIYTYTLRLVEENICTHDDALLVMVDHWAAVRKGTVDCCFEKLLPIVEETEQERQIRIEVREAKRALTKHNKAEKFVVCVETGDVFSSVVDAARWAMCSEFNLGRALKHGGKCTAGNLHWKNVCRTELNVRQIKDVHLPHLVRKVRGLPEEHIKQGVAVDKLKPTKWFINGQQITTNLSALAPSGKCFLCVVVCEQSCEAAVYIRRSMRDAWYEFVHSSFVDNNKVYEVRARLISKGYTRADKEERRRLKRRGYIVLENAVDHVRVAWKTAYTKACKSSTVVVCVETDEVYTSASALATAKGISKSKAYALVRYGTAFDGQHWYEVSKAKLTTKQIVALNMELDALRALSELPNTVNVT